jgi:hypothetical protein
MAASELFFPNNKYHSKSSLSRPAPLIVHSKLHRGEKGLLQLIDSYSEHIENMYKIE